MENVMAAVARARVVFAETDGYLDRKELAEVHELARRLEPLDVQAVTAMLCEAPSACGLRSNMGPTIARLEQLSTRADARLPNDPLPDAKSDAGKLARRALRAERAWLKEHPEAEEAPEHLRARTDPARRRMLKEPLRICGAIVARGYEPEVMQLRESPPSACAAPAHEGWVLGNSPGELNIKRSVRIAYDAFRAMSARGLHVEVVAIVRMHGNVVPARLVSEWSGKDMLGELAPLGALCPTVRRRVEALGPGATSWGALHDLLDGKPGENADTARARVAMATTLRLEAHAIYVRASQAYRAAKGAR